MTVLIVDHLPERREPIGAAVRQRGQTVQFAGGVEEALARVADSGVRVVLSELRLPTENGIALARRLKERWPEVVVVLVGADATAREYKEAIEAGVSEVLTHDPTPDNVSEALAKAMDLEQGRFTGLVHGMSLTDILQMLHFTRRSATVRLGNSSERIHLRDGQIVHATSGGLSGKLALRQILTRRSGAVFTAPAEDVEETIEDNFEALLLDLMRDIDEASRPAEPAAPVNLEAIAPAPSEDLAPPASEAPTEVESADLLPLENTGSLPGAAATSAPPPSAPVLVAGPPPDAPTPALTPAPLPPPAPALPAEARAFNAESATPAPTELSEDSEPVTLPPEPRTWPWVVLALGLAAAAAAVYLWPSEPAPPPTPNRGLRGERVGEPLPPNPASTPEPTPPPAAPTTPVSTTSAAEAAPEAAPHRVTIVTRPAGLVIIDHGTGLPLGNAPVEMTVPASGMLSVRAQNGSRTTPELKVQPQKDQAEVELDLRSWVAKSAR